MEDSDHQEVKGSNPKSVCSSDNGHLFFYAGARAVRLHEERLAPRPGLPPLLVQLEHRPPEALHYLGTSFGVTQQLYSFWKRAGYSPVYLRQTASEITGKKLDHSATLVGL